MTIAYKGLKGAHVVVPTVRGSIKQTPEDFQVSELIDFEPSGEGEHVLLHIKKQRINTEQFAKALARHAGVPYRDVGYCGLKDYFAVTDQWFSVRMAGKAEPDWSTMDLPDVEILAVQRHSRKLKRGAHSANRFKIKVTNLEGELASIDDRLSQIKSTGVPNYFGEQRFGRDGNNVLQAKEYFQGSRRVKNRNLRSILLSSARAFLFNRVLSERVTMNNWNELLLNEPAILNGSQSFFISSGTEKEKARLLNLDIHPSAPMWGRLTKDCSRDHGTLQSWEFEVLSEYPELLKGLEAHGLNYQRRATRMQVMKLNWQIDDQVLQLEFELNQGQFATSVLREIVSIS